MTVKEYLLIMVETNSVHSKNLLQFREVIQPFINGKMNSYNKIKVSCNAAGESITIEKRKYQASLFMIHKLLRTMELHEIAETLEIPYDLLIKWENEKTFKTLMYSNYKEFLIYLGELYT
jgi:hypothetical protein